MTRVGRFGCMVALAVLTTAARPTADSRAIDPVVGLSAADRAWLGEIELLILPAERDAYEALTREYQRLAFRERFWRARDPLPRTARNELQEEWRQRQTTADDMYSSHDDPRRTALLLSGLPDRVVDGPCGEILPPLELWLYGASESNPDPVSAVFVRDGPGRWRWWEGRSGLNFLATGMDAFGRSDGELRQLVLESCPHGDVVLTALDTALDREDFIEHFRPRVNPRWVEEFQGRLTELPAGAPTFDAEVTVRYPGRDGLRTVVQTLIAIPAAQVATAASAEQGPHYDLRVNGEVLHEDKLFENFHYRYQLPAVAADKGTVPVMFERHLRPGHWRLAVRIENRTDGSFFRAALPLDVPTRGKPAAPAVAVVAGGGTTGVTRVPGVPGPSVTGLPGMTALPSGAATPGRAASDEIPVAPTVEILPLPHELATGPLRVEAQTEGEAIEAVEFWLDDRPMLRKTEPPFSVELDVGHAPRPRKLRVVALDARSRPVASDETMINGGPNRLEVSLLEPYEGGRYGRGVRMRAQARVEVPPGEELDRLELYLNERLVGTLYKPPFSLPLRLPARQEITWVRARACLVGGRCNEDLVFVRAPEHLDELDVHMVEFFVTAIDRRGRPVDGLKSADFRVVEDGNEQSVRRFELARDLASYSVVLLDVSSSMLEELTDAEHAALGFFERVLSEKDRCAVMAFADEPRVVAPLTGDLEAMRGGMAEIVAEGETALWDGVVHSLHYLAGLKGPRALIVISDGEDTVSRFGVHEVLEYAAYSQVTIYPIMLTRRAQSEEARSGLQQLAENTGGRMFEFDRDTDLDTIYATIEEELHSQYLLAYQSSQSEGEGFREVDVDVARPGVKVRTASGYYP